MFFFSSFNKKTQKGRVYYNSVTQRSVKRSSFFDGVLEKILLQQLSSTEKTLEGKLKQLITAELLYRGIIVPEQEKCRELEYLKSLVKFSIADNVFFNSKVLTEAKLELLGIEQIKNRIIFCGIPVDIGAARPGTRYGPQLLRERSAGIMFRGEDAKLIDLMMNQSDFFKYKEIYDLGNINLQLSNKNEYLEKVKIASSKIYQKGIPFFIGGDHLFTLPILKGIYEARQTSFTLVQMDYHLDVQVWDEFNNNEPTTLTEPTHANFISWAHKCIPGLKTYQIGINNYQSVDLNHFEQVCTYLQKIGTQISNLEVLTSDKEVLLNKLPCKQDVYLTIDVDVLNHLYIPNTGYPAPLGMQLRDFYNIITHVCKNNHIIGIDIMEFGNSYKFETQLPICEIVVDIILQIIKNIKS